ncbi:MAG: hypothetical protein JNL01_06915 [Bdellovibrionales bacterium]|nr:hypothetical protein [Bdellovibrionales bacterium]
MAKKTQAPQKAARQPAKAASKSGPQSTKSSAKNAKAAATPAPKVAKGKPAAPAQKGKAKAEKGGIPKAVPLGGSPVKMSGKQIHHYAADQMFQDAWAPGRVCMNACSDKSCKPLIEATGYCRMYYIKNWGTIQKKKQILSDGQLDRYIKEVVEKYPDKYIDVIREDLSSPIAFQRVVETLELSDEVDVEGAGSADEEAEDIIENVKGEIAEDDFDG